jgi:hypothetical protein
MKYEQIPQTIHSELIPAAIFYIRGLKVMLSTDLAKLYGIEVKVLIQAVKRNSKRFPDDFMFQLTSKEYESLRSQFVTLNEEKSLNTRNLKSQIVTSSWGGVRRAVPYAFTEQGVAMLSSVLRSDRAIKVNIKIMRMFVKLRKLLATSDQITQKVELLEKKYDKNFSLVFKALDNLMSEPEEEEHNPIGFDTNS